MTHKVVFDTNILLLPYQQKVDIFDILRGEIGVYKAFVPNFIVNELTGLAHGTGARKQAASMAISLLARFQSFISIVDAQTHGSVDDSIINFAKIGDLEIFTNDLELQRKARAEGIKVYFYRKAKKGIGER